MKFHEIIQSDRLVLVDFYAVWCGPCKMMAPLLEQLKANLGEGLTILKVDVDRNPAVANSYQISGVPTLIAFRKGQVKWRHSGVLPVHELERILKDL